MGTVLVRGERVVVQWIDGAAQKRQRTVKARRADGAPLSIAAREREGRRLVADLEDLAARQREGLAPRARRATTAVTFGDLHACWEAAKARRSRSFAAWVRPHVAELFPMAAADVTTALVTRLLAEKGRRLSSTSVGHIHGHLHAVFEAARVQGGPWEGRPNPVAAAEKPRRRQKQVHIIGPDEWPALAPELPGRWRGPVAVSFFTGLRRGDVFALRKRDVDLARGVITSTNGKTGKLLALSVVQPLRPYLEEALGTVPGAFLFDVDRRPGKRLPNLVKMLRRPARALAWWSGTSSAAAGARRVAGPRSVAPPRSPTPVRAAAVTRCTRAACRGRSGSTTSGTPSGRQWSPLVAPAPARRCSRTLIRA